MLAEEVSDKALEVVVILLIDEELFLEETVSLDEPAKYNSRTPLTVLT